MTFQEYMDNLATSSPPEAVEAMREIQIIMNHALGSTPKINGFGINEIKFDLINVERAKSGIQLNLEAKGNAMAKSKEHISLLLQKLVSKTREDLWKKKIFFEIMYHEINVFENKFENNRDIGLKTNLYFTVICAAIIFN